MSGTMLLRILRETVLRRKKKVGLAVLAVLIGSSLATALLSISNEILDKISREMRVYGANILVTPTSESLRIEIGGTSISPKGSQTFINEDDLIKLKTIFWRNNILGFAPYLNVVVNVNNTPVVLTGTWFEKEITLKKGTPLATGSAATSAATEPIIFKAGVKPISPWWKVSGRWVDDAEPNSAILGNAIAEKLKLKVGDTFIVERREASETLYVAGILNTGGYEDNQIFTPLSTAQRLLGIEKGANRVLVSALTMPKEKLAPDIRNKRPEEMTPAEYEKWYCSPTIDAIVTQIKEVIPNVEARPIRQISEAEGAFAIKVQLLVLMITVVALFASALGVATAMSASVSERQSEIGLMKAIGADSAQIAMIFLAEAAIIGASGGILGFASGYLLTSYMGVKVFNVAVVPGPFVFPTSLALAVAVALIGSALPVRRAMRIEPVILLRRTGGVE